MLRDVLGCLFGVAMLGSTAGGGAARAGTPTVIYAFQDGPEGGYPIGNLVADSAGNLYGATQKGGVTSGGHVNAGVVFELSPPVAPSSTWTEKVLYTFTTNGGAADGYYPAAGLVRDSAGNLYGTTSQGGGVNATGPYEGTAFKLSPPAAKSGAWTDTTIYRFQAAAGANPVSVLTLDNQGNLYGVTEYGGVSKGCPAWGRRGCGVAFRLSPPVSGSGFVDRNRAARLHRGQRRECAGTAKHSRRVDSGQVRKPVRRGGERRP